MLHCRTVDALCTASRRLRGESSLSRRKVDISTCSRRRGVHRATDERGGTMWHYVRALVVPAVLIATSAEAQPAPDTRRFDEAVELKPATSFGEQTTLRGTGGTPKRVTLTIRNWIIQNRQRIPVFPEQGLLVIQIRAGSLTTIING